MFSPTFGPEIGSQRSGKLPSSKNKSQIGFPAWLITLLDFKSKGKGQKLLILGENSLKNRPPAQLLGPEQAARGLGNSQDIKTSLKLGFPHGF